MLLDTAVGILLAIGVSLYFDARLTPLLLWSGIVFVLLPDIDFLIEFARHGSVGGKVIREHRNITHFPILYALVMVLIFIFFGAKWAVLLGATSIAHFLHDSIGLGWGIKWLWPFSKKAYKFFSNKKGEVSKNLISSWGQDELKVIVAQYGDPNWLKNNYLCLSKTLIIEMSAFLISIFILLLYLFY